MPVTIEDPTVWVQPWTVKEEFTRKSDWDNKLFTEPRCIEGNYGCRGSIRGRRMEERALAEGRGPDPATRDAMRTASSLMTSRCDDQADGKNPRFGR